VNLNATPVKAATMDVWIYGEAKADLKFLRVNL